MQAVGLKTYIWNNNWRSIFLLVLFPVLLLCLAYAGLVGLHFFSKGAETFSEAFLSAWQVFPHTIPYVLLGSGLWFVIAYFAHQSFLDAAMGARKIERREAPHLYNLLENLCIRRGWRVPDLRFIETPALNAYASGLREGQFSVTLTRGLVDSLTPEELEAVIAHELSHIAARDVRTMVIAVIFVGIISFLGEMLARFMLHANFARTTQSRRQGGGNAAFLILFSFLVLVVAYGLSIIIRFALSRSREYAADAGAVDLTNNPDAMIAALRRIEGQSLIQQAPEEAREMFIDNPHVGFMGLFATHPPISKRVERLVRYAGGQDPGPLNQNGADSYQEKQKGPWENSSSSRPKNFPLSGPWD